MAYFRCTTGGSGKGNTLVVTCADDLAGATITCTNGTKTYTKTCPSTSPYEVTFYGLVAGTWTVSATVSGNTYTTTVVVVDCAALLGGFSWRTWVDTASQLDSSDYNSLDEVLADEEAVRELCLEHACVDYMASIATANADVETIINNDLFAKWVNNSDYALDFLHANEIIADYMDDADKYGYGEWVITDSTTTPPTWGAKGNVPVMTANNAPYGEAIRTGASSGYEAYKAFDNDPTTCWIIGSTTLPAYVGYKFTNPVCVKRIMYQNRDNSPDANAKTFKIQGSNTAGSNDWHDVSDILTNPYATNTSADNSKISYYDISNSDYYLYYRMYIMTTVGNRTDTTQAASLQFYGRELSVSVPKMATNTTPYGEAFANNSSSGGAPYRAFNNESQGWYGSNSPYVVKDLYVGYGFDKLTVLKMATIQLLYSQSVSSFKGKIQASADNTNWVDVSDEFTCASVSGNGTKVILSLLNNSAYNRFRMLVTQTATSANLSGVKLQFYGLDYSEKEFEQGSTKKWLYDHGVELETLTPVTSGGTVTKSSDEILMIAATSGNTNTCGVESNSIDFTNYNYMFAICGDIYVTQTYEAFCIADSTSSTPLASMRPIKVPKAGMDISSINQTSKLRVGTASTNGKYSLKELWLE